MVGVAAPGIGGAARVERFSKVCGLWGLVGDRDMDGEVGERASSDFLPTFEAAMGGCGGTLRVGAEVSSEESMVVDS